MTAANAEIELPRTSTNIRVARGLLVVMAILFAVNTAFFQTLLSVPIAILFTMFALIVLIAIPILLATKQQRRQSRLYAGALALGLIACFFGTSLVAGMANSIAEERAKAFIDAVNSHLDRTGVLPADEQALAEANISLPYAPLGGRMHYRVAPKNEVSFWRNMPKVRQPEGKHIDETRPSFVIVFDAGILVVCSYFSQGGLNYCDD